MISGACINSQQPLAATDNGGSSVIHVSLLGEDGVFESGQLLEELLLPVSHGSRAGRARTTAQRSLSECLQS